MTAGTSRAERDDVRRMIRLNAQVAKAELAQRAAEAKAQFEAELARQYLPEDDPAWKEAWRLAERALAEVNARIAASHEAMGIRPEFAPHASIGWSARGENAMKDRRAELRRVAEARLAAMHKDGLAAIATNSARAEIEILSLGLRSAEARALLEAMPTPADLLPGPAFTDVEALLPQRTRGGLA